MLFWDKWSIPVKIYQFIFLDLITLNQQVQIPKLIRFFFLWNSYKRTPIKVIPITKFSKSHFQLIQLKAFTFILDKNPTNTAWPQTRFYSNMSHSQLILCKTMSNPCSPTLQLGTDNINTHMPRCKSSEFLTQSYTTSKTLIHETKMLCF